MSSYSLKDFFASWPPVSTLEKTRQQVVAELRASFDATEMIAPCCSSSSAEPLFHRNGDQAARSSMCSPGSHKDDGAVTNTGEDNTSTTTSSTLEESIVSSENNNGVVVRRIGRMDAINDTKKRSRKRRPRRRVCLLENCDCPYHHALEERSMGPIDVDSLCEERTMTDSTCHESNSIVEDSKSQQSSNHTTSKPGSGTTAHRESASTTSWEYFPSARADGGFEDAKLSKENGGLQQDDQLLPRFTGDLESAVHVPFFPRGISWNTEDGTVLDETEMSRGLVGYQEGCEPEVIAQYTVLDVKRWELEHDKEEDDTFHQISSPPSHASHSRGSSSRQSRTSREARSRQSRSHRTGTSASASTTYPKSIPASAAEV